MTIVRKALLLSSTAYLSLGISVIQMAILSRALGPSGVGQLTLLRQTLLLAVQLASMGLPVAMVSFTKKSAVSESEGLLSVTAFCAVSGSIATLILVFILASNKGGFFGYLNTWIVIAAGVWVMTVLMRAILYSVLLGRLRVRSMAIIDAAPQFALTIWYGVLWSIGTLTITACLVSEALIVGVLSLLIAISIVRPLPLLAEHATRFKVNVRFLTNALKQGLETMVGAMLLLLNGYVGLVILKRIDGDFSQLGFYSRGVSLATTAAMGFQALQRLLYANWVSMDHARRQESAERTINVAVSLTLIASFAMYLMAPYLIRLLFGERFLPAVPVARVAVPGACLFLVVRLLTSLFNADHRANYSVLVLAIAVATNVFAAIILVTPLRATGSALALVVGYTAAFIVALYLGKTRFNLRLGRMLVPSRSLLMTVTKSVFSRKASA